MDGFLRRLECAVERTAYASAHLAAASAILLTAVVTYGVVMRFVFNRAQNWTDEVATYSLLWMVFLGLAYALSSGSHIRIDFFTGMLPRSRRSVLEVAVWTVGTLFAVLLFLGCLSETGNFVRRHTHSTAGLDIPLYWPSIPMVVGAALFGLAMLTRLLRLAVNRGALLPPHDDSGER